MGTLVFRNFCFCPRAPPVGGVVCYMFCPPPPFLGWGGVCPPPPPCGLGGCLSTHNYVCASMYVCYIYVCVLQTFCTQCRPHTLCMLCILSMLNPFQPPPPGWTQPIRGGGATRPGAGIIY